MSDDPNVWFPTESQQQTYNEEKAVTCNLKTTQIQCELYGDVCKWQSAGDQSSCVTKTESCNSDYC